VRQSAAIFKMIEAFWSYLAPTKIVWCYLKRFKSYRIVKQTKKHWHPRNRHYWKPTHSLHYHCTVGICGIDFFLLRFGFGSVFWEKNSDSVWNEFGSVKKMRFGLDIIVISYSCNSWVVNLQQILQRQWMTWLWCHWHHSQQQRQQVNNVISF